MEGKNSKADVVLGLDNNLLEAAAQSKLFAKSGVPGQRGQRAGRLG
jgi:thiamine transport system substrate-binding protein